MGAGGQFNGGGGEVEEEKKGEEGEGKDEGEAENGAANITISSEAKNDASRLLLCTLILGEKTWPDICHLGFSNTTFYRLRKQLRDAETDEERRQLIFSHKKGRIPLLRV